MNRKQAAWMHRMIARDLGKLQIVRERMIRAGIEPTDLLLQRLLQACDALQSLTIEAHYRSLEGGVGRAEE